MSSLLYGTFREPLTDRPAGHAVGAPSFGVFQSKLRSLDPRPRARRRPRSVGVFCSEKSPLVPQLFCPVSLIVKHRDSRGRVLNFGVFQSRTFRMGSSPIPFHDVLLQDPFDFGDGCRICY